MTRALLIVMLLLPFAGAAQEPERQSDGVAVVHVDDHDYTIPILCDDAMRPEMGFSTEPSRVTHERTGRASMARLGLRTWKDTDVVVVTFDRYVAWIPRPASTTGVLSVETSMSPTTVLRNGVPTAYTYEMWNDGDRPEGLESMTFEARCGILAPAAPSVRRTEPAPSASP